MGASHRLFPATGTVVAGCNKKAMRPWLDEGRRTYATNRGILGSPEVGLRTASARCGTPRVAMPTIADGQCSSDIASLGSWPAPAVLLDFHMPLVGGVVPLGGRVAWLEVGGLSFKGSVTSEVFRRTAPYGWMQYTLT